MTEHYKPDRAAKELLIIAARWGRVTPAQRAQIAAIVIRHHLRRFGRRLTPSVVIAGLVSGLVGWFHDSLLMAGLVFSLILYYSYWVVALIGREVSLTE